MQTPTRKPGKYTNLKPDIHITEAKYCELKNKLERLKNVSRPREAAEVRRLAEMGDFSENVGYQIAKGRLRGINKGIDDIEKQLKNAVIIQADEDTECVKLGHTVTVLVNGKEKKYMILGSAEANPSLGIISSSSPIGSALLGHRVNDVVKIELPEKEVEYKILNIQ